MKTHAWVNCASLTSELHSSAPLAGRKQLQICVSPKWWRDGRMNRWMNEWMKEGWIGSKSRPFHICPTLELHSSGAAFIWSCIHLGHLLIKRSGRLLQVRNNERMDEWMNGVQANCAFHIPLRCIHLSRLLIERSCKLLQIRNNEWM